MSVGSFAEREHGAARAKRGDGATRAKREHGAASAVGKRAAASTQCERGAASVEFALVLPILVVALLLVVQVALLVATQLSVQHAAREGAREAAVSNDDQRARDTALRAGGLDPDRAEVRVSPDRRDVGDPVRVTIRYRPLVAVPYITRFVPAGLALTASVEARTERAQPG